MQKQVTFKIKGMNRDLSESAFNPEMAYEIKNMRIMSVDDNTLLSLVNEKGTSQFKTIADVGDYIEGVPIGQTVLDKELVVFTTQAAVGGTPKADRIYKFWFDVEDGLIGSLLFPFNWNTNVDLNFNVKYPIEAVGHYENEELKKVYWTDGLNQPRFINISASDATRATWNSTSFDFVRALKLTEVINIDRNLISNGEFAPGTIQYSFTYFNKYGQESNIFYTSPLYYTSHYNRGGNPEEKVSNSFNITITGADTSFDYLRIYSTLRTSINATPLAKRVIDLKVSANMSYTDNGLSGESIDPTRLLYIGGEDVVFGTISHKDNTLFLGNIKLNRTPVDNIIKTFFNGKVPSFTTAVKTMSTPYATGYYAYENQLKMNAQEIKTFKYLEYYRFGVQLQHKSGKWSEPIYMSDLQNTEKIITHYDPYPTNIPIAQYVLNDLTILNALKDNNYVNIRPVVVYPELNDREVLCQGILAPTVYNVQDRYTNSPFAQASWFVRPNNPFDEANAIKRSESYTYYHFIGFTVPLPLTLRGEGTLFTHNAEQYKVVFYIEDTTKDGINNDILVATTADPTNSHINTPSPTPTLYELDFYLLPGEPMQYCGKVTSTYLPNWNDLNYPPDDINYPSGSIFSKFGTWDLDTTNIINPINKVVNNVDSIKYGAQAEFRHDYAIPSNMKRNGEIQCIWNPPQRPYLSEAESNYVSTYIGANGENFYVDQSIFTFHSPDIEFDTNLKSLDESALKLRIVGIVPITASSSDIDIQTSTPQEDGTKIGFYEESIGSENLSPLAGKSLINGVFWMDSVNTTETELKKNMFGFAVYPFHRNGSLNNAAAKADVTRAAWLSKKKMSNLKFSYNSYYYDIEDIWKAEEVASTIKTGISGVAIFDSNEQTLIKLPSPKNSEMNDIVYYGNIDKVLNISRVGDKKNGYPIVISGDMSQDVANSASQLFRNDYRRISDTLTSTPAYGTDPIRMKYKSTPHAVMALNYTTTGAQRVLPTIYDQNIDVTPYVDIPANSVTTTGVKSFWRNEPYDISQDVLLTPNISEFLGSNNLSYSYLWLAELYNDSVSNRFGGTTEEALENNLWVPCGNPVPIVTPGGTLNTSVTIKWEEGDTYYQRYDHLKTYPYTQEDQNGIVEIVSFMCETRINLDGRYDRNRAQINNLTVTPTNFNLMNPVYSQSDNFFAYRALNTNKLNLNYFPNMLTWTLPKTVGELVDSWTNITLASTLDLDGDRGILRALKRFNNELFAFQDTGLSNILYNSRTMINTSDGVPIELANSDRVDGKRYISNSVGCVNKWAIAETAQGLYFVDDIGKSIYLFNGKLEELTIKNGFHSWLNGKSKSLDIWNPSDFKGMVVYYDKINKEVLFISSTECLVFSEPLGNFSSFYSYEHVPYFVTLDDVNILLNPARVGEDTHYKLWKQHGGDYNKFFDKHEPFYTTIIANPDGLTDKIFNNLEFRADTYNALGENQHFVTFDKLYSWNEYQSGTAVLADVQYNPSTLKKKFRVWRANIPRDSVNTRDRMRNPWLYLKLAKEGTNVFKTVLHDLTVSYFI